jgi:hypothetical protein
MAKRLDFLCVPARFPLFFQRLSADPRSSVNTKSILLGGFERRTEDIPSQLRILEISP